jgi:Icc protein
VNDVHIGESGFGAFRKMREPPGSVAEPYPSRCLRAAVAEAVAWGAQRIIAKGDLTDRGKPGEFAKFAEIVQLAGVPVDAILGNHDVKPAADGPAVLRSSGLRVATSAEALDLPGLRVILMPSAHPGFIHGHWMQADRAEALRLAAEVDSPVFVATHHNPQRFDFPNELPTGVPRREAKPFLDGLDRVQPGSVVACGHTHRHHRRHYNSLLITEIGSTKDFPGAWAGYVVYEGGIRQIVRRVEEPSARAWTDRTGRALFGLWRYWAPGLRSHRCWTWTWPTTRR